MSTIKKTTTHIFTQIQTYSTEYNLQERLPGKVELLYGEDVRHLHRENPGPDARTCWGQRLLKGLGLGPPKPDGPDQSARRTGTRLDRPLGPQVLQKSFFQRRLPMDGPSSLDSAQEWICRSRQEKTKKYQKCKTLDKEPVFPFRHINIR